MNLPVIVLKGIILLPNNDIRLEFDDDINKNIIDISELFHDNKLLVISEPNSLEESLEYNDLPKKGVIAKISHKIELPNGKTRVILAGINRAEVHEYLNINKTNDVLESIVSTLLVPKLETDQELALCKKLYKEIETFIKVLPYVSNSILSIINNETNLNKMTDIVAMYLQISTDRLNEYLLNTNPVSRLEMILDDIYSEQEMFKFEREVDSKVQKNLDDSQKEYLLREKIKVIKEELGDASIKEDESDQIREKIKKLNCPKNIKDRLNEEIKRYEGLSSSSPEVNIVRNYIDWLLSLPWNNETVDNDNLNEVKEKLDNTHNGLDKIKLRIIEYLAVKQMTNSLHSPIICLVGPPGVGKTSLAMSIAESINRKFVKMSVGGVNDEAEIIGHRRTYIGASPGRIIQGFKKAKSCNPVFLIDEIDKMTRDYKGDPASVLLEILDPEQNQYFSDNYIEEEFDLSKTMFITTANSLENIPDPLRDRLEIIELSSYTELEKLNISNTHLISKICREHGVNPEGIQFKKEAILKIIRCYTKEAGVRELERQIAAIIRKIVTEMVMKRIIVNKYIIDNKKVNFYLGNEKYLESSKAKGLLVGIANGLSYTPFGGDVLPIEVISYKGTGKLLLTGSLGDVLKESAEIALSYIKANYKKFNIKLDKFENDIHIHMPEGAIKKDGPSAGVALTTALISTLSNTKIDNKVAFTGEITLTGNILKIGGLKEKIIGANHCGIKKVFIPELNKDDLLEIPEEVKENIEIVVTDNYQEIWRQLKEVK